jgi:hypothetical protein
MLEHAGAVFTAALRALFWQHTGSQPRQGREVGAVVGLWRCHAHRRRPSSALEVGVDRRARAWHAVIMRSKAVLVLLPWRQGFRTFCHWRASLVEHVRLTRRVVKV